MHLTIDFETRSFIDIKAGAWRYAEDSSTEVMCLAIKVDDQEPRVWVPPYFKEKVERNTLSFLRDVQWNRVKGQRPLGLKVISRMVSKADTLEAHNAEFERAIWHHKMVPLGLPEIPIERWRCSAAKAAACSLPRPLDGAIRALGLPKRYQKDMGGHKIMMRLCKPKKPTKKSPGIWDETPEKLIKLFKYCQQDVNAEHHLSINLPDLSPFEQKLWFLDQKINTRGFQVDMEMVDAVMEMMAVEKRKQLKKFKFYTGLNGPRQIEKLKDWLAFKGLKLDNLSAETVQDALDNTEMSGEARETLIVRQKLSKSSTDKFKAFKNMVCRDGRVRGAFMFHGAGPGRWTGKGIQPHNMPRKAFEDYEYLIELIIKKDKELIELLFDDPMAAASKCIRNAITAKRGYTLIAADFSAIEGRDLAWLAGEEHVLEQYRQGLDPYKMVASSILGIPYDEITKAQRAYPGKVAELSGGYQGSANAARKFGAEGTDKEIKAAITTPWRENRPKTVEFWKALQSAAVYTIQTGKTTKVGKIKFGIKDRFLLMKLPSGRYIRYYNPSVATEWVYAYVVTDPETGEEDTEFKNKATWEGGVRWPDRDFEASVIKFWGVDPETKQWKRKSTYGGRLAENATMGTSRDRLAIAMMRIDEEQPIVLHVHDEMVSEIPPEKADLKRYEQLMSIRPDWSPDCPIAAKGWVGFRYRKD